MLPPESVWGYDLVTSAYSEKPSESWQRIYDHVKNMRDGNLRFPRSSLCVANAKRMYEEADDSAIVRLIGKKPEE